MCGDGICEAGKEGRWNCAADCPAFCGDLVCDAEEVNSCCGEGNDCTVQITCGDGVCSACENAANCSRDCGAATPTRPGVRATNTLQPTSSPTASQAATNMPTTTPTSTAARTPSPTNTPAQPSVSGEQPAPLTAPVVEPQPEAETCDVTASSAVSADSVDAAQQYMGRGRLLPNLQASASDQVWIACEEAADSAEICVPRSALPPDAGEANLKLVDCSGLECLAAQASRSDEQQVCFSTRLSDGSRLSCRSGCMVYREETPLLFKSPILAVSGGVILIGIVTAGVLGVRKRRASEESPEEEMPGG